MVHSLISKIANHFVIERLLPMLYPRQLGVGVQGGAEATVFAARAFINSPCLALVFFDNFHPVMS